MFRMRWSEKEGSFCRCLRGADCSVVAVRAVDGVSSRVSGIGGAAVVGSDRKRWLIE